MVQKLDNENVKILADMLAKKAVKDNLISRMDELTAAVSAVLQTQPTADTLGDVSMDLGNVTAGRMLALSAGSEPTDTDAVGTFFTAAGETFPEGTFNIGGVNNGELQFGLSSADGKAYAGAGAVTLDKDGVTILQAPSAGWIQNSVTWKKADGTETARISNFETAGIASNELFLQITNVSPSTAAGITLAVNTAVAQPYINIVSDDAAPFDQVIAQASLISLYGSLDVSTGVTATINTSDRIELVSSNSLELNSTQIDLYGDVTVSGKLKSNSAASPGGGVGYDTGAGGTVTQLSTKANPVALDAYSGKITMNGAALANSAAAQFNFNNACIKATDILLVSHVGGGNLGDYDLFSRCASGQGIIRVRNLSGASKSDAIQIQFIIISGVNA